MRPKADAVRHLDELTADLDLAAFVVFSSAAASIGAGGQANYAAANAFLDAYAARRAEAGRPMVAVEWGLWAERSGMTAPLGEAHQVRAGRAGILPMSAQEGLALFDTVFTTVVPPVVVAAPRLQEEYLREQIVARNKIIADAQARGVDTSGWELSDQTLQACEAQLKRIKVEEQQQNGVTIKE